MRKRRHGMDVLRLYRLGTDGDTLEHTHTLTQGFLITRDVETQEGSVTHTLTIDLYRLPNLTEAVLQGSHMVALANLTSGAEIRFRVKTNVSPSLERGRYVCSLSPAYNDAKVAS